MSTTSGRAAAADLLQARLYGLEEILRLLRADLPGAAPAERVRIVRQIRETRVRVAKIRLELMLGGRPADGHHLDG